MGLISFFGDNIYYTPSRITAISHSRCAFDNFNAFNILYTNHGKHLRLTIVIVCRTIGFICNTFSVNEKYNSPITIDRYLILIIAIIIFKGFITNSLDIYTWQSFNSICYASIMFLFNFLTCNYSYIATSTNNLSIISRIGVYSSLNYDFAQFVAFQFFCISIANKIYTSNSR